MISSRALSMRAALGMTAVAEFFGAFVVGIAVAKTIGCEVVNPAEINTHVILAVDSPLNRLIGCKRVPHDYPTFSMIRE